MQFKAPILDRLRRMKVVPPAPETLAADPMGSRIGRFPVLSMRAVPVNPYKPNVQRADFPVMDTPIKRWVPPSIHPQMIIRTGATPDPSGRTVPLGAVHTPGPVKVDR